MEAWQQGGASTRRGDVSSPEAAMQLRAVRSEAGQVVDFEWMYANASTLRWLGLEGVRLHGRRLLGEVPWARECGLFEACVQAMERRVPDVEPFVCASPEGPRLFLARLAPADDGLVLFVEDLGPRLEAEECLRRERELLRAVIESTTDAIYVKDLQGRYMLLNASAARAFGRAPEELLGRTDAQLLGPGMAEATLEHDRRVLAGGQVATYEDAEGGPGRGVIWQTLKGVLRRSDGTAYALFGISRDVTARRRLEEEREQEGRLRERFLGVLGHDLGNPLAAIRLSVAVLLAREELAGDLRRVLGRIDSSAERMARLVKQLLDFARARLAGGIPLRPRETVLEEVARHIICELELVYPKRAIHLEVRGDCRGVWDDERLGQVLSNLVANALQNSPEGTPVWVRLQQEGTQQRLEVHNLGAPISEALRASLFEPFHAHEAREAPRQGRAGLGLGLYIVAQIVQAHGGQVQVHSTLEEGTRFTVLLPRGPQRPTALVEPEAPSRRAV